jgi:FMN reductase
VVEHAFRPLFGFFGALAVPTAVYASDPDFRDGVLVDEGVQARVADAASQIGALLSRGTLARSQPTRVA